MAKASSEHLYKSQERIRGESGKREIARPLLKKLTSRLDGQGDENAFVDGVVGG